MDKANQAMVVKAVMVALVVEQVTVCLKLTEQVIMGQLVLKAQKALFTAVQELTNKTNQSAVNRAISPHFIVNNNKKQAKNIKEKIYGY